MSEEYFTEHDDEPRLLISKAKFNQLEKDLEYFRTIYNTLIDGAAKDRDRINELTETIKEINEWYEEEFDKRELLESKLAESERKLSVAVKALDFYGDWKSWKHSKHEVIEDYFGEAKEDWSLVEYIESDGDKFKSAFNGKRAREALKEITSEQGERNE